MHRVPLFAFVRVYSRSGSWEAGGSKLTAALPGVSHVENAGWAKSEVPSAFGHRYPPASVYGADQRRRLAIPAQRGRTDHWNAREVH